MIKNKLKSIGCLLTIAGAAISNAGCNTEGGLEHLGVDIGPIAQYAAASDAASSAQTDEPASAAADNEHPTHAEARHFAVYSRYRALTESSGSSGSDGRMHSGCDAQSRSVPGGESLSGIEHFICPDDGSRK